MLAGQVNQFLSAHSATFTYAGSPIYTPTLAFSTQTLGGTLGLAYRFESPSYAASLGWVALALGAVGAGCDVFLTLQGDTGAGPDGTILASCYIPAEWLPSGNVYTLPTTGFPLVYAMTASTWYNIVLTPVGSLASSINDVVLTQSTEVSGAYTFDGASWNSQAYGFGIAIYSTQQTLSAATQNLVNVLEDDSSLHKRYQYNGDNLIVSVQEWAMKLPSAPQNMLCRDDASFEISIGTFSGVNCTVAQSTLGDPTIDGDYSLVLTVVGTPAVALAGTNLINPTNGVQYISVQASSVYSAVAFVAPQVALENVSLTIIWYDGTGSLISSVTGGVVAETAANEFTPVYCMNQLSPINAALAILQINIISPVGALSNGEVHYIDAVGMFANSNTTWSYPGVGITSSKSLTYNAANDPTYVY